MLTTRNITIIAAKRMHGAGRLIAFEPFPGSRKRLNLHLRLNGVRSVTIEPYAIGRDECEAALQVVDGHGDLNSLRHPATNFPVRPVAVQTTTLDQYLERKHIAG